MQTLSPHKNKATELELILDSWERRYEWRLLSRTVPRSLIVALLVSLVIGVVGYFRFRLSAEQFALIAAGLCGLGFILNLLYTLLFPRKLEIRARYFDITFDLRERVSTAFELMQGRITTHPEIESRQIADALAHARAIDPRERISMDFRRRELGALFVLLIAVVGMIFLPAIVGGDLTPDAPSAAVEEALEDLREIIETVAKDTDLDDVDRQELLEALEIALERLQEEDISDEEAFAAMSQLQAQLEDMENELGDTIELDQSALEAAADALQDFLPPSETEDAGASSESEQAPDLEDLSQALDQMAQEAEQMSPEEAQAAAEALQNAAEELEQMNSELSEQMQGMSAALQEADQERLQEQLDGAQEQLAQEQQEGEQNQNARAMLQEQSEQAEEAADAVARRSQDSGQPQEGQAESSESGQQNSGQEGEQQSAVARPGNNPGDQQPNQNQPGSAENAESNPDSRSSGAGAGEGDPNNESLAGAAGEDQGAETDNRTTGAREIEYEALYSPVGETGGGDEEIMLETDARDTTFEEGDFDDNPVGESRVSYDTVFSDYQNAANRALESDYVPLGLRDVVRDYFTSLEPNA